MQLRLLLVKGEYNTLILQWVLSINHMWMAPACEGVKFRSYVAAATGSLYWRCS
jgi:hypothetical protein